MRFLQKRMGARAEGGVSGKQGSRPRKPAPGPPGRVPADGHVHLQHRGVVPLQGGQDAEQVRGPQVEEANHQGQQQQDRLPLGGHWALLEQEERPQGQGQVHCRARGLEGKGPQEGAPGGRSRWSGQAHLPHPARVQTAQEGGREAEKRGWNTGVGKKSEKRSQKTRKQRDIIIASDRTRMKTRPGRKVASPGAEGVGRKESRLVKREAWASSGAAHALSAPRSCAPRRCRRPGCSPAWCPGRAATRCPARPPAAAARTHSGGAGATALQPEAPAGDSEPVTQGADTQGPADARTTPRGARSGGGQGSPPAHPRNHSLWLPV